jgi:tetratricopeptide (TPR) repeat protein
MEVLMARAKIAFATGVLLFTFLTLAGAAAFGSGAQTDEEIDEAIKVFNRAKMLHQEKQYNEAIREYRAALKIDEDNPFIYNSMGLALAAVLQFDDALRAFTKALSLNPDYTDVYNNLGMVYAELGQKEKAFDAFGRAIRNPHYPTPEKALFNLGNLYLVDGNLELALIHFKRAVEKEPTFALGQRGLGNVYLQMGDEEAAIRAFEKAVELFDEDSESLYQLARLHEREGAIEEAQELYRRVVEIDRFSRFGQLALASLDALKGGS